MPISKHLLDIGTLTRMLRTRRPSHAAVTWRCIIWRRALMTSREKISYACAESDSYAIKTIFKVTDYCKWHKILIAI